MKQVTVLGAGLAGSECAWQLSRRGIPVRIVEMKPVKMTPAHHSEYFVELVCSNSLRRADQRRGPAEGGNAADGLSDHGECRP